MIVTTESNLETKFNQLLEFFGNSLDVIEFDITQERKERANKNLPQEQKEICQNCIHCEHNFCLAHSIDVNNSESCEDCELKS
ncbi:MAG: hypothetical protein IPL26_30205 [Leptospiraceae bacterium]|nr:hypothetical protein [Leptospiraceae bacterium]